MQLEINVGLLRKLELSDAALDYLGGAMTYRQNDDSLSLPVDMLTETQLERVTKWCAENPNDETSKPAASRINTYLKLKRSPGEVTVSRLEPLATALKLVIGKTERKWLFAESEDGHVLPYLVTSIRYHEPARDEPAHTSLHMSYMMRGEKKNRTLQWRTPDLKGGKNPVLLLREEGFYLETAEQLAEFDQQCAAAFATGRLTGNQFSGTGKAFEMKGWWGNSVVSLTRDGEPTKLVMDDESDESDERRERSRERGSEPGVFWSGDKEEALAVPMHPYLKCFDLAKHSFLRVHIANLAPYEWQSGLVDKLVLPDDKKDLVQILVQGAALLLDDIVKGKTGGIIIAATGEPGTGKTLTAEIYGEEIKRPLYVVQCSQLGTDEETLEKRLRVTLERAMRWQAILLIDEADVYVHERGDDIQQNAIVGVFLRVLEYYRGVLFLTSNRATIIDDAILSRVTAHIRYELPSADELCRIWQVLAGQFTVKLTNSQVDALVSKFRGISGRNVKTLLKLARLLAAQRKQAVDVKLIEYVARFVDLASRKEGNQ